MHLRTSISSYYEKFLATGEVKCIDDEIPFEIPQGWEWCRIRNISQSYIGLTYSPTDVDSNGVIVLRSSNIQNGKIELSDLVRVSKDIPDKLKVEKNDIVICARNGSAKLVGKSAIIREVTEPMTFGAFMAICKTPLYEYVYLFLQSDIFYEQLRGVSSTTTINQLTQNNFNNFLIPVPPKEEQLRICEKLYHVLPYIEQYGQKQESLSQLNKKVKVNIQKSVLQEAIQGRLVPQFALDGTAEELLEEIRAEKKRLVKEGKLKASALKDESRIFKGEDNKYYEQIGSEILDITEEITFDIPDSWRFCRLGNIVNLRLGKTPPRGEKEYWQPGIYPWVSIADMRDGETIYHTKEAISKEGARLSQNIISPAGSLIMSFKLTIGKISILGMDAFHNEAIITIRPYIINQEWFLKFLPMIAQTGSTKDAIKGKTLNSKTLNALLIPVPPLPELQRILAMLEEISNYL